MFTVRPVVFTETLAEPGMVPEGVTDSHELPDVVAALAVKLVADPPMVSCCAAGCVALPSV